MEIPVHCTVSDHHWSADVLRLALLTTAIALIHGFHPWAEDGGLYIAGVELLLQPSLFPLDRPFVSAPSHYSLFASAVAWLVRLSHLSLPAVLFGLYLFSTMLLLYAALVIARHCFPSRPEAQWAGVALLAAWCTLPVAGTSLLLVDPYLTARSFSTPLTLLALGQLLPLQNSANPASQPRRSGLLFPSFSLFHPVVRCSALLAAAAVFHPLMAIHAALFSFTLLLFLKRAPSWWFVALGLAWLATVGMVQISGYAESSALQLAVQSRYYWFLSNWQWFEWLGLAGPLAVLFAISAMAIRCGVSAPTFATAALCRTSLFVGLLSVVTAVLFVQEHFAAHAAARLQPLRAFLAVYALLPVLLGGTLGSLSYGNSWKRVLLWTGILASSFVFFAVQRASFPQSPHIEWPGHRNPNAWVQAFLWARQHTAENALFALDEHYVNTPGEDAQNFRALAQRSTVADFSKDGGEAANFPELAPAWLRGATATTHLSQLSDAQRAHQLNGLGVTWLILKRSTTTALICPYTNETLKVCRLPS